MESHVNCILELNSDGRGLLFLIQELINNINSHSLDDIKLAWHSDLRIALTVDQWDSILDLIHASSTSAKHSLIQLKVVHRPHRKNAGLVKTSLNVASPADLMHIFWLCPTSPPSGYVFLKALVRCLKPNWTPTLQLSLLSWQDVWSF